MKPCGAGRLLERRQNHSSISRNMRLCDGIFSLICPLSREKAQALGRYTLGRSCAASANDLAVVL